VVASVVDVHPVSGVEFRPDEPVVRCQAIPKINGVFIVDGKDGVSYDPLNVDLAGVSEIPGIRSKSNG
jgi:hypothetical protein